MLPDLNEKNLKDLGWVGWAGNSASEEGRTGWLLLGEHPEGYGPGSALDRITSLL